MSCQSQGRITMAHQGRRITMAQPLSSIIRDLVKSSRSSRQAAATASIRQAAAGKQQQASSSKQAATSVCPLERMNKYKL